MNVNCGMGRMCVNTTWRNPSQVSCAVRCSVEPFARSTVARDRKDVATLPVVTIIIKINGMEIKVFALIDTSSQVILIKDQIAKKLRPLCPAETACIGTIHGKDPPFRRKKKGKIINRQSLPYGYWEGLHCCFRPFRYRTFSWRESCRALVTSLRQQTTISKQWRSNILIRIILVHLTLSTKR